MSSVDKTCEVNASKALKMLREAENVNNFIQNRLKASLPGWKKDEEGKKMRNKRNRISAHQSAFVAEIITWESLYPINILF